MDQSRAVGRREEQELPLPLAARSRVSSGCLVEPDLGREVVPFVSLLEVVRHPCCPSFLLSGSGNGCGPGPQVQQHAFAHSRVGVFRPGSVRGL